MKIAIALVSILGICLALPAIDFQLIKSVNSQKSTWTAGINDYFRGMTLEDSKKLMGWKVNPNSKPLPTKVEKVGALPDQYDSSAAYPHCFTIGKIYDQAKCGSCWAFGCVEAVQDRFCIQDPSNKTIIELSFEDEVSCGPDDGCEGGSAEDAFSYAQQSGLVTAACYPYSIPTCPPATEPCLDFVDTPACNQTCNDRESWSTSKHFVSSSYNVASDEAQIRQEIFTNGPVEACFSVYSDFLNYKTGVYQYTSGDFLGGHCIKIIGWGTEDGTPYWLINNSWTTYWGDQGQFKIIRGVDNCGIEDDVVAGMVQL